MEMEQAEKPPVSVSPASKSCCVISEAPPPEAQTWAANEKWEKSWIAWKDFEKAKGADF